MILENESDWLLRAHSLKECAQSWAPFFLLKKKECMVATKLSTNQAHTLAAWSCLSNCDCIWSTPISSIEITLPAADILYPSNVRTAPAAIPRWSKRQGWILAESTLAFLTHYLVPREWNFSKLAQNMAGTKGILVWVPPFRTSSSLHQQQYQNGR